MSKKSQKPTVLSTQKYYQSQKTKLNKKNKTKNTCKVNGLWGFGVGAESDEGLCVSEPSAELLDSASAVDFSKLPLP